MKEIKILQTSDIHSYIFSHDYVQDKMQGLLSYADYIKELQKKYEVLLIDSGDMFQGSALSYFLSNQSNNINFNNPITDLLNNLNYTVFTPGNHEFNYGQDYLQKSLANFKGDVLVANITGLDKLINCKPYELYKVNNKVIAIIGFTTKAVPTWEKPNNISGLTFNSIVDTYQQYEKELLTKSDMIIVNYHGGFESDLNNLDNYTPNNNYENEAIRLLKEFKSIDILLTGHQHRAINQYINGTLCVQPYHNGMMMNEITLNETLKIIKHTQVQPQKLVSNSNIETLDKCEKDVQTYLDMIIGHVNIEMIIDDIFKARLNSHPLVNFINDMQLEITGADVSAMSLFDSAIGFSKDITIRNIIANYPFPNTLKVLEINQEDLKDILEVSASYFVLQEKQLTVNKRFTTPKAQHFNYDLYGGIKYTFDLTKESGNRVSNIEFINKNIDLNKIKIVVNNYRSSSFQWYPAYENKKVIKETNIDMIELLIKYISDKKNITVSDKSLMKIIK